MCRSPFFFLQHRSRSTAAPCTWLFRSHDPMWRTPHENPKFLFSTSSLQLAYASNRTGHTHIFLIKGAGARNFAWATNSNLFIEILGRQNFLIKLEQTCKLPPRPRDQMILSLLLVHMKKMNFCKSVSLKMFYMSESPTRYRFEECGPADRLNLVGMTGRQSGMRRATGSAILRVNLAPK